MSKQKSELKVGNVDKTLGAIYVEEDNYEVFIVMGTNGEAVAKAKELVHRWNSHDALLEACKNSPAPNHFAEFANFAEDCSTKPSMAVYRRNFVALSTFLRSCVDRSEKILQAIAEAEEKQ